MPMNGIYPGGTSIPFQADSPAFDPNYPFRGVLHTTESTSYTPSATTYYGTTSAPHFTVVNKRNGAQVFQHFSVNSGARALRNQSAGVETNRGGAIQIEIAWNAGDIRNLPDGLYAELNRLIAWISQTKGIQMQTLDFFPENKAYGSGAASRMSFQQWQQFNGWCGHQHVPENLHWDPCVFDVLYVCVGRQAVGSPVDQTVSRLGRLPTSYFHLNS